MHLMYCSMDSEFKRNNAALIAQEQEEEEQYASLKKHGIPCDGCSELFMFEQLEEVENDFNEVQHVCKDC